ncbi:MAG: D-glycero-beta-D-manno-heptose 1-phosphate adenylyltransferase [Thermodesulfobacteriota bacterium]
MAGNQSKILNQKRLIRTLDLLRKNGRSIVFTNGCFDILHVGHVRYLAKAKSLGQVLVVGLNSDESVRRIKGRYRPVNPQSHRAELLAALGCVDFVTIFDEEDPLNLITRIMPDVLVKGADWEENEIVGARIVKENGGKVKRVRIVSGVSTSGLIERIRKGTPL